MMDNNINFKKMALASIVALVMPMSASAETWKFAIEEIPGSIMDAYAKEFKRIIEDKTDGDVDVVIYPLGSLGTPTEVVEMTSDGVVQLSNISVGNLGTIVPESQIFLLPYFLPSDSKKTAELLSNGNVVNKYLAEDFNKQNIELLTMYSEGEQVWTTNKLVRTPDEFNNFKMRVMVSPILLEAYENMGADPTPLAFGDVYGALQLKTVDGQVNPISAIEEMKFYEVTDYLIWAGEEELVTAVMASGSWFNSLSDDRQMLVKETISGMQDYIYDVVEEFNNKKLEEIKQEKPEIKEIRLTDEEREVFKERTKDTVGAYIDLAGERGEFLIEEWRNDLENIK